MARRKFISNETSAQPVSPLSYEEDRPSYLQRRRDKKEADRNFDRDYSGIKKKQLEQRERVVELKKKEIELRRQERELAHPVRTRAMRRAEKLGERMLSEGEQTVKNIPRAGAQRLRKAVSRQRPIRIQSGFTQGQSGGRTRLPVFAEGAPSFAERVAMDFGEKPQEDILAPAQPKEFFTNKSAELFGESNQLDLGLGSSNGNKKKPVRYY